MDWTKTTARQNKKHLKIGIKRAYIRDLTVYLNGRKISVIYSRTQYIN